MKTTIVGVLLLFAALMTRQASAHPHVWVDAKLSVVMEDGKATALDVSWLFDEFYSELVRGDFDQDRDGALSRTELDALVGVSAVALSAHSFFTHLRIGEERPKVAAVKEFYADDDGVQISYRFRVPLREPVDVVQTPFSVGLFDEGYYVAIELADKMIEVGDPACRMQPKEDLEQPLYYGLAYPTYYHLTCGSV
ncbi:MAG: DUF1007 family protein [Rhodospirillales bacterium]|nr:DUF1007 family protein [Rhodospirillales bacterium]